MDLNSIIYYVNQGGPIAWTLIITGAYKGYYLVVSLLTELQTQNTLSGKQNGLLEKQNQLLEEALSKKIL